MVAVTTTVALVSLSAAVQARWALVLVVVVAVVLFLTYRAYSQLDRGNAEVEQLYGFTRALDGARALDDLVAVTLDLLRDVLRVETAELAVEVDGGLRRIRLTGQAGVTDAEFAWTATDEWMRPAMAGKAVLREPGAPGDGMAVPVALGSSAAAEGRAALIVTGSLVDSGPFTEARLRLFEALANHAAAALGRAVLVDRLRGEVAAKLHLSLHDPLTGLPNRRYFHELLDAELHRARTDGTGVAVILLDLDRFKEINDALGHETGDALLREVGARLRTHLAGRGAVARLGGDEFAVLLPTSGSAEAAVAAAAELDSVLERAIRMDPLTITARASIGVAAAPQHGDDAQTLVRHADVAMYTAKQDHAGPRLYDPAADVNSPRRLAMIADLRDAVERRDLLVAFQPKVEPRTGRVVGAEALARWHHPRLGNVPPDEFIPLAEHSGLIRPLTVHVLEVALRRRASWARAGHDLHVAVNLSPNSLLDVELPDTVAVQLGHALDLEVVAEGVEDAETYGYLAREGCDVVQGYYLSRPLPPDEFLEWVIHHETSLILSASQD
jgi:diguanylate cyclase (GGDEF)-like protein